MNRGYMSSFADDLDGMIDLKVSLGYAESTFLDRSRQFDFFCAKNYPAADLITEALAMSWLRMDAGTANGVIHSRAAFLRGLARYQNAVGKAAYSDPNLNIEDFCLIWYTILKKSEENTLRFPLEFIKITRSGKRDQSIHLS